MNERTDLDPVLGTWLRAEAPPNAPDDLLGPVFDVTSASRPLPRWRALLSVSPMRTRSTVLVGSPLLRLTGLAVVAAVLGLLAVTGALLAGSSRDTTVPRSDGLLAYGSGGDIYVGDPATGETRAIVAGPGFEAHPIFSPDGRYIAFYRSPTPFTEQGAPATAAIDVVRADGTDERRVMTAGFAIAGFAWTPDGTSLVVNHGDGSPGFGGVLSLADATGVAEPRLLTPPLPTSPGAYHAQIFGEIAPMFRPPKGDRVLSFQDLGFSTDGLSSTLFEMDIDGSNLIELIDPARTDLPFEVIGGAIWSPDAAWIAVTAHERCGVRICYGWEPNQRVYVVSADGEEIRRLTAAPDDVDPGRHSHEGVTAWSPDGSRILIERNTADYLDVATLGTATFASIDQTLVVDVATGAEQAIGAPRSGSEGPPYGEARAAADAQDPPPYGQSSSWSPDGRMILVFEGPGTRPLVIDVETGTSTRLPWETDSHPSWRVND